MLLGVLFVLSEIEFLDDAFDTGDPMLSEANGVVEVTRNLLFDLVLVQDVGEALLDEDLAMHGALLLVRGEKDGPTPQFIYAKFEWEPEFLLDVARRRTIIIIIIIKYKFLQWRGEIVVQNKLLW